MKDGLTTNDLSARVMASLRDIADFPKPGIVFKDITPVLADGALFHEITQYFRIRYADHEIDRVVGIESRGFIFGAALAHALGVGLTLIRKPGKLPYETVGVDYALEYGTDRVEMHVDGVSEGDNVIIIDDVLATGGTSAATVKLLEMGKANIVECAFFIELGFLDGRKLLNPHPVHSLITL